MAVELDGIKADGFNGCGSEVGEAVAAMAVVIVTVPLELVEALEILDLENCI